MVAPSCPRFVFPAASGCVPRGRGLWLAGGKLAWGGNLPVLKSGAGSARICGLLAADPAGPPGSVFPRPRSVCVITPHSFIAPLVLQSLSRLVPSFNPHNLRSQRRKLRQEHGDVELVVGELGRQAPHPSAGRRPRALGDHVVGQPAGGRVLSGPRASLRVPAGQRLRFLSPPCRPQCSTLRIQQVLGWVLLGHLPPCPLAKGVTES